MNNDFILAFCFSINVVGTILYIFCSRGREHHVGKFQHNVQHDGEEERLREEVEGEGKGGEDADDENSQLSCHKVKPIWCNTCNGACIDSENSDHHEDSDSSTVSGIHDEEEEEEEGEMEEGEGEGEMEEVEGEMEEDEEDKGEMEEDEEEEEEEGEREVEEEEENMEFKQLKKQN